MMDFPGRGRSGFIPGVDGQLAPPRSGPLMEEICVHSRAPKTGLTQPGADGHGPTWPQFSKYSAWPSTHPKLCPRTFWVWHASSCHSERRADRWSTSRPTRFCLLCAWDRAGSVLPALA